MSFISLTGLSVSRLDIEQEDQFFYPFGLFLSARHFVVSVFESTLSRDCKSNFIRWKVPLTWMFFTMALLHSQSLVNIITRTEGCILSLHQTHTETDSWTLKIEVLNQRSSESVKEKRRIKDGMNTREFREEMAKATKLCRRDQIAKRKENHPWLRGHKFTVTDGLLLQTLENEKSNERIRASKRRMGSELLSFWSDPLTVTFLSRFPLIRMRNLWTTEGSVHQRTEKKTFHEIVSKLH